MRLRRRIVVALLAVVPVAAAAWAASPSPAPKASASPSPSPAAEVVYVCPMHPEVIAKQPGKCPKCGMFLEKKAPAAKPSGAPRPSHGHR